MSRRGRLLIGLVVSAAFIGLAVLSLREVSLEAILASLSAGNYGLVGLYVLLLLLLSALRVVRWGALVRCVAPVSWRRITAAGLVGQMAIGLLPMRLGEAARPMLIVERGRIDFGEASATAVVERVVDGILLGVIFAVTLWALRDQALPASFRLGAYAAAALFGGLALFLVLGSVFHYRVLGLVRALLGPITPGLAERLAALVESFLLALRTIVGRWRHLVVFGALTAVLWLLTGLSLMPIFAAFGIDLPWSASFAVVCVMVLGYLIPAGPAATGTLNYAIVLGLSAFGVADAITGALAILLYVLLLGVNVAVGLVGLWLLRRPWREVLETGSHPIAEAAAASPPARSASDDAPSL